MAVVTPAPVPRVRGPYTRYFKFSKWGCLEGDVDTIINECVRIDSSIGFKTRRMHGQSLLSGVIVLRGVRTYLDDLQRCFPLLNLSVLNVGDEIESGLVFANGDLPFEDVRRALFVTTSPMRSVYRETLDRMGAPNDWNGTVDDWMFSDKTESQQEVLENWKVVVHCDKKKAAT